MSQETRKAIQAELETIRQRNAEKLLKVADVVEFAKDPATALHKQFTWDNSRAAHQHRLDQARGIIQRFWVIIEENGKAVDAPVWVSIDEDRREGGGYRLFDEVRIDPVQHQLCLNTALRELEPWRKRYESIKALAPVFKALDRVAKPEKAGKARHGDEGRSKTRRDQTRQARQASVRRG